VLISEFDPWNSPRCTCPPKYSFGPYTGCSHACIYCYISAYVPWPFTARPKRQVVRRLARELPGLDRSRYLSMANSSDPYPPLEAEMGLTRRCLSFLQGQEFPVLILTKSDLVARDADLLADLPAAVSMTITTLDPRLAAVLEPGAPPPEQRLEALTALHRREVPCILRLDPIIPGLTDQEIESIVEASASFCGHVVASTVKPRPDGLARLRQTFPREMEHLSFSRRGTTRYLPEEQRRTLLQRVASACRAHGLTYAACRENVGGHTAVCDGSHLIPR